MQNLTRIAGTVKKEALSIPPNMILQIFGTVIVETCRKTSGISKGSKPFLAEESVGLSCPSITRFSTTTQWKCKKHFQKMPECNFKVFFLFILDYCSEGCITCIHAHLWFAVVYYLNWSWGITLKRFEKWKLSRLWALKWSTHFST